MSVPCRWIAVGWQLGTASLFVLWEHQRWTDVLQGEGALPWPYQSSLCALAGFPSAPGAYFRRPGTSFLWLLPCSALQERTRMTGFELRVHKRVIDLESPGGGEADHIHQHGAWGRGRGHCYQRLKILTL